MFKKIFCILFCFSLFSCFFVCYAYYPQHTLSNFNTSNCGSWTIPTTIQDVISNYSSYIIFRNTNRFMTYYFYSQNPDPTQLQSSTVGTDYYIVICGNVMLYDEENETLSNFINIFGNEMYFFNYRNNSYSLSDHFYDSLSYGRKFDHFRFYVESYDCIYSFQNIRLNQTFYSSYDSAGVIVTDSDILTDTDTDTNSSVVSDTDTDTDNSGFFSSIINGITGGFTNIGNAISGFVSSVGGWFSDIGYAIANLNTNLTNFFDNLYQRFVNFLYYLLTPTVNPFTSTYDILITYFPFIEQVKSLALQLVSSNFYGDDIPMFVVDFSYFGGSEVKIIDLQFFQPYRTLIHSIIIAYSYCVFVFSLLRRLPYLITGNIGSGDFSSSGGDSK